MGKPRSDILDYLVYRGFRLFQMFMHMFPVTWSYVTFRLMADVVWRFNRKHRRRAIEHVKRSFPDWPEEKCRRVAKASIRSFFYLGLESLFSPRLVRPETWHHYVRLEDPEPYLRAMLERRSAVTFVTGHYGNFEMLAYTMSVVGFPFYAVARALDNRYLDSYLRRVRHASGLTILDKKGVSERADAILAGRDALGWVADQDAGRKGLFVDFFGRAASTYKAIALFAMRYDTPIIVGHAVRMDRKYHFKIQIHRIIEPADWKDRADPLRWITQEYTHELEQAVREHPEQYMWAHRRWKHRPKGEPESPDGIA